ncbi:unnamed protein product [Mycena citricolor]|uniref:Tetraspanin n=1 Tax=Mycena citricolor TaxID=2018698 RepID=A0AAD2HT10_9AGAR|nr:unnamed protein product [Mycena citricolor]
MSAKYLCCLPLRLGVFLITFLTFLATAASAGLLTFLLIYDAEGKDVHRLPPKTKIAVIALDVFYGIVALIALTGFVGAIRKKESYIAVFSGLMMLFFGFQVVAVVAFFVLYFVNRSEFTKLCTAASTDQRVIDACNVTSRTSVGILVASTVVSLLIQAYGVYIISEYKKKLHREGLLREETFRSQGFNYAPVETHAMDSRPIYPYADNSHSFGVQQRS